MYGGKKNSESTHSSPNNTNPFIVTMPPASVPWIRANVNPLGPPIEKAQNTPLCPLITCEIRLQMTGRHPHVNHMHACSCGFVPAVKDWSSAEWRSKPRTGMVQRAPRGPPQPRAAPWHPTVCTSTNQLTCTVTCTLKNTRNVCINPSNHAVIRLPKRERSPSFPAAGASPSTSTTIQLSTKPNARQ